MVGFVTWFQQINQTKPKKTQTKNQLYEEILVLNKYIYTSIANLDKL